MEDVPWSSSEIWMNVEIDETGNSNFIPISSSQLLAVPYAMHAATAAVLVDGFGVEKFGSWNTLGNNLTPPSLTYKLGSTNNAGFQFITNGVPRMSFAAGGGVNIASPLTIDGNLTLNGMVTGNPMFTDLSVSNDLTVGRDGSFGRNVSITNDLSVANNAQLGSATVTGLFNANGNANISGNLTVGGSLGLASLSLSNDLSVGGMTTLTGILNANNNVNIGGNLSVTGALGLASLNLTNDLSVGNNANITGTTTASGPLNANGRLIVNGGAAGADTDINSYPALVQGSNQGLAVKVTGSRTAANNFISFWDDFGMQGRIEGSTVVPPSPAATYAAIASNEVTIATNELAKASAEVAIVTAELGMEVQFQIGASNLAIQVPCGFPGPCLTAGPSTGLSATATQNVAAAGVNVAIAAANEALAVSNLTLATNNETLAQGVGGGAGPAGVTYQSGAGDYAEWLPKANLEEAFYPGDIVGVKGGLISKSTEGAEFFLVISHRPIVLGNMPAEEEAANFEKVAFMGQVPVKVKGQVNLGDYILPSGKNNGFGFAIAPDNITAKQASQIIGVAWSASQTDGINMVNVAVGLNANDVNRLMLTQEEKVKAHEQEIAALKGQLAQTNQILAELVPGFAERLQPIEIIQEEAQTVQLETYKPITENILLEEPVQTNYSFTKPFFEQSIRLAKEKLASNGVDVVNHPFFSQLEADSNYKEQVYSNLAQKVEAEVKKQQADSLESTE